MKDLKTALKDGKVTIGTSRTLKFLKLGKLKKVYTAVNCPSEIKDDIKHYSNLNEIPLVELKENNEEVGILCKKTFFISVLGI
ncbi:50S ribosomal protein L30 [archaeon]|nr:50S ribosomal protein L30 [archaeon]|tara:strand:- start:6448 stop:6696 length:249 start_codon:yes stop_codon:yes gene_type:complete